MNSILNPSSFLSLPLLRVRTLHFAALVVRVFDNNSVLDTAADKIPGNVDGRVLGNVEGRIPDIVEGGILVVPSCSRLYLLYFGVECLCGRGLCLGRLAFPPVF